MEGYMELILCMGGAFVGGAVGALIGVARKRFSGG